jgi:hypothetical protein
MTSIDLIAATGEAISEARAVGLIGRAELLALGLSVSALGEIGIRCREDLEGRTADDMWLQVVDETARTNPRYYDSFCHAVYVAGGGSESALLTIPGWQRRRERAGFDPLTLVWRHRHGDATALPRRTSTRLRMPTIGVSAALCDGDTDPDGRLVTPLGQKDVTVHAAGPARLLLGHWMWNGGHGAFVRLEDLEPGDGLEVRGDWFGVMSVAKIPGDAVLDVSERGQWLVLATPPHRRVGVIGTAEMLPPVERDVLRVVVIAEPTQVGAVNTIPRPLRRISGAY